MFRTSENWEVKGWLELAETLYSSGTRGFRIIEVTDGCRYHVDIEYAPRCAEHPMYRTFMLNDAEEVISLLNESKNALDLRISIQSAFNQSNDYVISSVVEIANACDRKKNMYLVFYCSDGRSYATPPPTEDIGSLVRTNVVWPTSMTRKLVKKSESKRV